MNDYFGIPVHTSGHLREDQAMIFRLPGQAPYMIRGLRPLTEVERAGNEARRIVRESLADVLAWLGEKS